jgi:hypothetical protein
MLRRLSAGGRRIRTIGSAKMLPTFEVTQVDFFWPDLSTKKPTSHDGKDFTAGIPVPANRPAIVRGLRPCR